MGLTTKELDFYDVGLVLDMYEELNLDLKEKEESNNAEEGGNVRMATQADFDNF